MARQQPRALSAETRMEYQRCRAIGHRWESIPVTHPPAYGAAIDLRCENCSMIRRDIISRISGVRIGSPRYIQPEGYRDAERHDKAWWRAAFLESLHAHAKDYINTVNEQARHDRKANRQATHEWRVGMGPLAKAAPPNPSPRIRESAQQIRRNQTARKAMKQT